MRRLAPLLILLALLPLPAAQADFAPALSPQAQELYALLEENREALEAGESAVTVHRDAAPEDLQEALRAAGTGFLRDNPQLFWLGGGYSCAYTGSDAAGYELKLELKRGDDWGPGGRDLAADRALVEAAAEDLAAQARAAGDTRCERLLWVHDWLTQHNLYNSQAQRLGKEGYGDATAWTALAALNSDLRPVCEGYCAAFKLLCDRLDIPCVTVTGQGHGWNYVQMEDGAWYAVDVTYDDPIYTVDGEEQAEAQSGGERRQYFLLGSETFFQDHREDGALPYPALSPTDYPLSRPFADVAPGAWYAGAVEAVTEEGLMVGTGQNRFSPEISLTLAQAVTLADRLHLRYYPENQDRFRPADSEEPWYAPALAYAQEMGFALPEGEAEDVCTREGFVLLLASAVPEEETEAKYRGDAFAADDFSTAAARRAALRFYRAGIVGGVQGDGGTVSFQPQGELTRAQCAAILERLLDSESRL